MQRVLLTTFALITTLPLAVQAAQDESRELRLITPPWPGVTVKSEILSQLIEPLGYRATTQELSSTVGYSTLQQGDSDAFLAGWLPAQQESYDAAMASGTIVDLGNNVEGARMGFAVPGYVADEGITSAEQLADPEVAARFEQRIYSIESGSTVTEMMESAIDQDTYGLAGWSILSSSTPGMLSEVASANSDGRWILFYGWTPHWMVPAYDVRILDDPNGVFGDRNGDNDVKTIVAKDYVDANPNMTRLLDQFAFTAEEQSAFISAYSQQERELEDVARQWLADHPERVTTFLEGVTTFDGEDAQTILESSQ
ncbi:glycine betaine ABC transporter substrate-binding protein [Halomonas sp. PAMB 3264]|uniref:glycine betaine ABC transporter substrate-binding protein n=1 Tax=Halomonas sp. PAMB 3264 TaxID=3075222 RepID=UPI0028A1631E|nr:glycine betaine ABC transporter substrate-binding protein [Halomonas sp. PAMB 3264]WNL43260.1 glycine betaine ABC transporter substrate-binding protein [Halomonas sp. PAMB 3264]